MTLHLTEQQHAILEAIGKNTTVSAGAGAGKTGVMVERYLAIVQQSQQGLLHEDLRAGVENILTITFTEDAASELKHRLVKRLDAAGMREERRQVETAYISTIHSFCSRLLKENPFEAGLDPQFTVLERGENALLLEQAFEQIVEDGFRDSLPEVVGLFRAFSTARRFGDSSIDPIGLLRREATALCDHLRSRGWKREQLQEWLAQGPEAILAANTARIAGLLEDLLSDLGRLVREIRYLPLGVECAMETARRQMLDYGERLEPLPSPPSPADLEQRMQAVVELRPLAGKRTVPRGADPRAGEELKAAFQEIADRVDAHKKLLPAYNAAFEEETARQCFWLLQVTDRLWDKHAALKQENSRLDFNDLQSFARDLLETSSSVRARYRRRLRHIMVDEFQDTDGLQKQILDLLSEGRSSLFCVGDPKQSIYGFRNADVTIFRNLIDTVRRSDPGTHRHLALQDNFRCRPEIIALVNHVFSSIGVGQGIEYEPLVSRAPFDPREQPSVELLLAAVREEPGGADNSAEPHTQEADLVAKRIRQMVDGGELRITAAGDRRGHSFQLRDFLILLRSFTNLREYEQALHRQGLDYYVVGGRGYYALREIRDIFNILKVIQNPLDDVALAATLRSPFCGLSDEALYGLARLGQDAQPRSLYAGVLAALDRGPDSGRRSSTADGGDPFAEQPSLPLFEDEGQRTENERLRTQNEELRTDAGASFSSSREAIPGRDRQRLAPFWSFIEQLRRKEDRTPIAGILEELLGETLYEARLLLEPGGRRKMANVRKLVAVASGRSACGVAEFLHWLGQQTRIEEKEGEAPTEEEASNVVRIRTIHNAKGLESPVVILGGFSRNMVNTMQRPAFLFDLGTGAGGCHYPHPESLKSQGSAAYSLLAREQERREQDEALRLLYVAMTRARECLLLAGSFPCRGQSWARHVLPCLGIQSLPEKDQVVDVTPELQITVRSRVPGHRRQSPAAKELLQRIQSQMRTAQPLDPRDLENLVALTNLT